MLDISILLPQKEAALIRSVRQQTLEAIGTLPRADLCEPLNTATYIAMKKDGQVIGLVEAFFMHRLYKTIQDCPYKSFYSAEMQESYNQVAHVRTIFMLPEYRKMSFGYIYLYLAATYHFSLQGARYATALTSSVDQSFAKLYEHTGGIKLGETKFPNAPGTWALYLFQPPQLLQHPLLPRMQRLLSKKDFTSPSQVA